jgi:hypothetical protein
MKALARRSLRQVIGVIGGSTIETPEISFVARQLGSLIIEEGYSIVCGGLGGVMEEVCKGAFKRREKLGSKNLGVIVGILPGTDPNEANPYLDIAIPTGIGQARNVIVVLAADAVVAVNGGSGTLSEMALGWQFHKPLIALKTTGGWAEQLANQALDNKRSDSIIGANTPKEVIQLLRKLL